MSAEQVPHERPILRRGASGDDVRALQVALTELGVAGVEPDGVFGTATERGVRAFQRSRKLKPDGIVGEPTWVALFEAAPDQPPDLPQEAVSVTPGLLGQEGRLGPVAALGLARDLLDRHPDLAGGQAAELRLPPPPRRAERLGAEEWIARARPLFDRRRAPTLDVPLVLWGLALLDADVGKHLWEHHFLDELVEEIPDAERLLTRDGRTRMTRLASRMTRKDTAAPTLLDRPALHDQLGRRAFATVLAARLVQLRGTFLPRSRAEGLRIGVRLLQERLRTAVGSRVGGQAVAGRQQADGPFLVHLHGAWGMGKTSLLNFFAEQLEHPSPQLREAVWGPDFEFYPRVRPWVVVSFNAWQHQRVAPPWWWLMTSVYHDGGRRLPLHRRLLFRIRDYWWRFWVRWPAFVVPAVALVVIASATWYAATQSSWFELNEGTSWYEHLRGIATALSAAAALAITLWSGIGAVRRWVLVGTARGAEDFLKTTADPMAFVQRRYAHLVATLGRPLCVVVDDLDRCKSSHVVELLEGIQTLFARAPVTYVVAADRRWLRECFAVEYEQFAQTDSNAGRQLGYHFLEKTFQLSTSIPRLDPKARKEFLQTLLDPDGAAVERPTEAEFAEAQREARKLASEQEIRVALRQTTAKPARKRETLRQALVLRASGKDIVEQTENLLAEFEHLLEPNPRAMKRLVNAYGFEIKLQLLERDWVETDQDAARRLALWTIAGLRWPALADFLVDNPSKVDRITGRYAAEGIPADLRPLFKNSDVRAVFEGRGVDAALSVDAVRTLARV